MGTRRFAWERIREPRRPQSPVGPGNKRPPWGRGPTLRRRTDQCLFVAAGDEVGPGNSMTLYTARIRADFPILSRRVNDKPLVYLDSAATTQKPSQVIDAMSNFYQLHNASVHRGASRQ